MRLNPHIFLLVEIETGTKFCLVGGDWNMNFLWLIMVNNHWLVVTGTMEFHDFPIIFGMECHHPN